MPTQTRNRQNSAKANLDRAKARLRRESLRTAMEIGQEITELRRDAGVSRKQMCAVLGVRGTSLYLAENPNKSNAAGVIRPETQNRYRNAVSSFCGAVKKAAAKVRFERSARGRPRNQY